MQRVSFILKPIVLLLFMALTASIIWADSLDEVVIHLQKLEGPDWEKDRKSKRVKLRVIQLAKTAKPLLKRRLERGKITDKIARATEFIHKVLDAHDHVETEVWRDLWLLTSAKQGGAGGTDFAGAQWFSLLLSDAKLRNSEAYTQALNYLDKSSSVSCEERKIPKSVCEIDMGGHVLRVGTMVQAGLELQRGSAKRLLLTGNAKPSDLFQLRLNLILGWWRVGIATHVEKLLPILEADRTKVEKSVSPRVLAAYHAMRAEIFEVELRFAQANVEFLKALGYLQKSKPTGNSTDFAFAAIDMLANITRRYFTQYTCEGCPKDLEPSIRAFILELATNRELIQFNFFADAYMFMRGAPEDFFSKRDKVTIQQAAIKNSGKILDEKLSRQIKRHSKSFQALYSALDKLLQPNYPTGPPALVDFIKANTKLQADRARKIAYDPMDEDSWQFGNAIANLRSVSALAFQLRSIKLFAAEHSVLNRLWDNYQKYIPKGTTIEERNSTHADLATVLGSSFARFAELEIKSGSLQRGLASLDEADLMISAKLNREWQLGSERAVPVLRAFRPALRTLARLKIKSISQNKHKRTRAIADAFRLVQMSMLSDTAAALQVSLNRKWIERHGVAKLMAERESLQVGLRQLNTIATETEWLFIPIGAKREAKKIDQKLSQVEQMLKKKNFLSTNSFIANANTVSARQVGEVLLKGEKLLIAQTNEQDTSILLIDARGRIRTYLSPLGKNEIAQLVKTIRAGVSIRTGSYQDFPVGKAYELFKNLFGPLAQDIATAKQLDIIVDGPLQSLPFAILPTADPRRRMLPAIKIRSFPVEWLVMKTAINRLPSVKTFLALRQLKTPSTGDLSFLGIGDPILARAGNSRRSGGFSHMLRSGQIADINFLRSLSSLPETADELRAIADALKTGDKRLITGALATETTLKKVKLENYNIIAFATHGLVAGNAYAGSEPGLVLTPPEKGTLEDDGFLTSGEIVKLRLNAELVILSACDTATSDGRPLADGLSGLARAFFVAGAQNLVATHWEIPSLPAVEITTTMVQEKSKSRNMQWSRALQKAQVALIKDKGPDYYAHPASWGAFELIGAK